MKTLFLSILIFVLISISSDISYSQKNDSSKTVSSENSDEVSNSLKKGMWSIQFGIGSNFTLTNFNDAVIAVKYNFSPKSALRLDFNINYENTRNSEMDYTLWQYDNYGTNLSFLYYINPQNRFNIYFNAGIAYYYNYRFSQFRNEESNSTDWMTGPRFGAGAEFFAFENMSLFAEYSFLFGFGKRTDNNKFTSETITENFTTTSFQKQNVKFGLSVYF